MSFFVSRAVLFVENAVFFNCIDNAGLWCYNIKPYIRFKDGVNK